MKTTKRNSTALPKPEVHLAPCPFCGSKKLTLDHLVDEDDYFVHCDSCDVQQIANYTRDEAARRWNTRSNSLEIERAVKAERKVQDYACELAYYYSEFDQFRKDMARLNWLESRRRALNQHYGTTYGWQFVSSHNVNRLFVRDVNTIDLNDTGLGDGDIRTVIDKAISQGSPSDGSTPTVIDGGSQRNPND